MQPLGEERLVAQTEDHGHPDGEHILKARPGMEGGRSCVLFVLYGTLRACNSCTKPLAVAAAAPVHITC